MAAVDVDLMESVQVQVPGALLVDRSIHISAIIFIYIYICTWVPPILINIIFI